MTRFDLLKRQFGFLALAITVAIGLIGAQTVGAMAPPPWQTSEGPIVNPCAAAIYPALPPTFGKVKAWRAAGGVAYVQADVEYAQNVQLMMPGTITLKSVDYYGCVSATYQFRITDLTPDTLYSFQLAAIGAKTTVYYSGSVMT